MGDEDERRAVSPMQSEEQLGNLFTGRGIEVAGRLVCQNDLGFRRQRTSECDALLFATRKLRRVVLVATSEADFRQTGRRAGEGVAAAGEFQRQRDVFQGSHGRYEMERLKDDADVASANPGESVFAERRKIMTSDHDLAMEARSSPAMIINRDVLPEPDGPTMATDEPGAMARLTDFRISTVPARLDRVRPTWSRAITGALVSGTRLGLIIDWQVGGGLKGLS